MFFFVHAVCKKFGKDKCVTITKKKKKSFSTNKSLHVFAFSLSFCVLDESKKPKFFRECAQEGSITVKTGLSSRDGYVHRVNESILQKTKLFKVHENLLKC